MVMRPVAEWPLLICGPILRRVTPTSVAVFVATSAPCDVQIRVTATGASSTLLDSVPQHTRMLGERLHVVVCELSLSASQKLKSGIVYAYDILMTQDATSGSAKTLRDQEGLLVGEEPLGYAAGALPTFSLSPEIEHLRIIHSSCRKPHGGGPDALAIADHLVKMLRTDPLVANSDKDALRRPHQLLLTGDQIYADDVSLFMLETLIEVGRTLFGTAESETFSPGGITLGHKDIRPGWTRETWLRKNSKLSSDHSMNHLMFFAEFCAMYVMCWSDELWDRTVDGTGRRTLRVGDRVGDIGGGPAFPDDLAPRKETPYRAARGELKSRRELLSFMGSVRRVRRALANIPTMMMFDDHEISDDWNLDRDWAKNAREDPNLHRIVRNGLLAYAVFQGWGNDPAAFRVSPGQDLLDWLTLVASTDPPLAADRTVVDAGLNIAASRTTPPSERVNWDWTIDGKSHRVIALDSRTRRDYSTGSKPASLLAPEELQRQLIDHNPQMSGFLCFVIAPAPVSGHPLMEEIIQPAMAFRKGSRAADHESWSVNRSGFEALLKALADFGRVVLLSGDVHYAFTNHIAYFGDGEQEPARIVQLCASSAKNRDELTRLIGTAGFFGLESRGWFGLHQPLDGPTKSTLRTSLLTATERAFIGVPSDLLAFSPISSAVAAALRARRQYFDFCVADRLNSPVVVPNGPWFTAAAATLVQNLVTSAGKKGWCYQVFYVSDNRPPWKRLGEANEQQMATNASPLMRDQLYDYARTVVGEPCIGQVTVSSAMDEVTHTVYWNMAEWENLLNWAPKVIEFFTRHVAPLNPPDESERPKIFRGML